VDQDGAVLRGCQQERHMITERCGRIRRFASTAGCRCRGSGVTRENYAPLSSDTVTHLRRASNVLSGKADIGGPGNIAHPVVVAVDLLLLDPLLGRVVESPNTEDVVGSTRSKALLSRNRSAAWCGLAASGSEDRRSPRDGVGSRAVSVEDDGIGRAVVWCVSGDLA
jgi:hypothetical protein